MAADSIVVASNNPGKLREIAEILDAIEAVNADLAEALGSSGTVRVIGPAEARPLVADTPPPDPIEDGATYLANAEIKARAFAAWCGQPALADDSGLEVDALDGAPGLHSARFAGENCTPADNIERILAELSGRPDEERGAAFVCCLALCTSDRLLLTVEGRCRGRLLPEPRGEGGFGYDPLFVPDGENRTFAEMAANEKRALSHRGRALDRFRIALLG